jgi:hypothetical protein
MMEVSVSAFLFILIALSGVGNEQQTHNMHEDVDWSQFSCFSLEPRGLRKVDVAYECNAEAAPLPCK